MNTRVWERKKKKERVKERKKRKRKAFHKNQLAIPNLE